MPRMDGTGPRNSELLGQGAMTGRGQGNCQKNGDAQRLGDGHGKGNGNRNGKGSGRGLGFGFRHGQNLSSNTQQLVKDELTKAEK
jgi:hypothetical protein